MTEAVAIPPDTRAIVQRRLIGLLVLMLAIFLLSLLLRARAPAADALPSVIIPLNNANANLSAPVLDAPEPEAVPTLSESPSPAASPVPAKVASTPADPKPRVAEKPAAISPKPVVKPPKAATKPATKLPLQSPKPPAKAPVAATEKPASGGRWFVAVGAYKDPMAAQAIAKRITMAGFSAGTVAITSAGERLNRVRAGPFANKADAESARVTLIVEGLTKATLVSEK